MNSQPSVYRERRLCYRLYQYTRDYHTFQGWNSQPDGGGTAYGDGQSVLNLTKILWGTVTLYAQWLPNTYIITFADGMDGGQNVQKGLLYTGKLGTLPEFIRKGYTFARFLYGTGWRDPDYGRN
ncbi:MAG: InlB B-repeat-containing protein [Enterocloster sp.]